MSNMQFGILSSLITDFGCLDVQKNKQTLHRIINEMDASYDPYEATVAHLLLSFYCMCSNESDACKNHLAIAKKNIKENAYQDLKNTYNLIQVSFYGLLGNDQILTQLYIDALNEAKLVDDKETEVLLLNSLATKFIAYDDQENALSYSVDAYSLAMQIPNLNESVFMQIIYHLVEIHIEAGKFEKAYEYLNAYDQFKTKISEKAIRKACNELHLYAKEKNTKMAILCADFILQHKCDLTNNKVFGFDLSKRACLGMHELAQEKYAYLFLDLMKELLDEEYITQCLCYENIKMKVYTTFEKKESLKQLYSEYFYIKHSIDEQQNANIRDGMKSKLDFFNVEAVRENLESVQNELKEKVYLDELTGIHNRAYIDKTLNELSIEKECIFGILSIDVDFLKEYNDTYGHVMGDNVLRTIGECLRKYETSSITACRYGGDEFICICIDLSLEELNAYVYALEQSLYHANISHKASKISDRITISVGYYQQNLQNKKAISEVIELADQALYKSKLKGRNTFTNLNEGVQYGNR